MFITNNTNNHVSFPKKSPNIMSMFAVTYFARKINEGLCYIEDFIFLENDIVWSWKSLDVQSTDSSVEL